MNEFGLESLTGLVIGLAVLLAWAVARRGPR
jgi:hypothetical protein